MEYPVTTTDRDPQLFDHDPVQSALATVAERVSAAQARVEAWRSLLHEVVEQGEELLGDIFDGLPDDGLEDDNLEASVREVFAQVATSLNFYRNLAYSVPNDIPSDFIDLMHAERRRQIEKWGDKTPPLMPPSMRGLPNDVVCRALGVPTEAEAKAKCDNHGGDISMAAVMLEEQVETLCAGNQYALRLDAGIGEEMTQADIDAAACALVEELVQVATVAAKAATPIMRKHRIVIKGGKAVIDDAVTVALARPKVGEGEGDNDAAEDGADDDSGDIEADASSNANLDTLTNADDGQE